MKNKRGMIGNLIGAFIVLALLAVAIMYSVKLDRQPAEIDKSPDEICKEQCILKNMSYYHYKYGAYSNSVCNCLNKNKEIETIYLQ